MSSGYHHIEIHPEHRKFLGFEWIFEDGSTKYFQLFVLPFGLSSACYVFTKLLHSFTKRWRYIDINTNFLTSNQLTRIIGQLPSKHLAMWSLVRLFTRNMCHEIENRTSWYEPKIPYW